MSAFFDPDSFWAFISSPEIVELIVTIAVIMMLPLAVAQLHSLLSAGFSLVAHRSGKVHLARALQAEAAELERQILELDSHFLALRPDHDAMLKEHDSVLKQLRAFRRGQIREIVCTEVFVTNGTLPFSALVRRHDITPEEEEHDPEMAAAWRKGRDCVLYAESLSAAQLRFDRRFPEKGGYEVGPVSLFELPRDADRIKAA
jgi:hypothetical protein